MKKSEARALVATLAAAFPRQQVPQVTFDVYTADLVDLDAGVTEQAVSGLRRSSKWFPTIAEIREAVAELQLDAPGPMEAYVQATHCAKKNRHPLVQEAKQICGDDWYWREAPIGVSRKAFLAAYAEVKSRALSRIVRPAELEATNNPRELTAKV